MSVTSEQIAVAANATRRASYKELLVERRDHVLVLQINRPEKRNALSRHGYYEIMRAISEATYDPLITMVVLTGIGDFFCAGMDLAQTRHYGNVNVFYKSANAVLRQFAKTIIHCPKILVALVNGPCLGMGVTLTGLFDVIYCTDSAYFETPFTRYGLCPEFCSSYTFPLILGRSKATELLVLGERMSAQEALQFHFVAKVFKQNEVQTTFWPKMKQYSELPPQSLRASKKLMRLPETEALLQAICHECAELSQLRSGPVHQQIVQSFMQRANVKKSKL